MPQVGVINYAHRVINNAPGEHILHWLRLQSSLTSVIYDCKTFILQATDYVIRHILEKSFEVENGKTLAELIPINL